MLSRRGANIAFVLMLSGAIAVVVSLALTVVNSGVDAHLLSRWARNGLLAWIVAFPAALVLVPPIRRLADSLVR